MKKAMIGGLAALCLCAGSGTAAAGVYGDELGKCLVESSSPQDKAALVRWMFAAVSLNPDVKGMTDLSPAQRDVSNREMVRVMERLLLDQCRARAIAAARYEGESAVHASFGFFGQVAARSLMEHPAVAAELGRLEEHLDKSKWEAFGKAANSAD